MKRFPSTEVAGWHELQRETHTVERAQFSNLPEVSFDYYLDEFASEPCDNLVKVIPCEDPTEGTEPIITVSSRIPERLRPYVALHEYIEFHTAQLVDSEQPQKCWEIERFVLTVFPDLRDAAEYVAGRLDMFQFLKENGWLTSDMELTVAYLEEYQHLAVAAAEQRDQAAHYRTLAKDAVTATLELESRLRSGRYVPDEIKRLQAERVAQEARDQAIASLLLQASDPTSDFRDRQMIMQQITALNGGEYPNSRQQAMLLAMYRGTHHEEDHHDAGPDIPG